MYVLSEHGRFRFGARNQELYLAEVNINPLGRLELRGVLERLAMFALWSCDSQRT